MSVRFEIVGFYYRKSIPAEEAVGKTVQKITRSLLDTPSDDGRGTLFAAQFDGEGFLQRLSVSFREQPPLSGQATRAGPGAEPQSFPRGVYSYKDVTQNAFHGDGLISFSPAWQYYIFDRENRLKSGARAAEDGFRRTIVPAGESNQPPDGVEVADGDRISWRLVAIGGVAEAMRDVEERLTPANRMRLDMLISSQEITARGALRMAQTMLTNQ
ncbi:MAG: hypothetical protein AAFR16_04345 [Pseudomonadota bacterium]